MFHSNSWKKYYFIGFVFWAIHSMLSLFLTHLKLSKENCSYLPKNYHKVEMICPQQYKYCYIAKHFNSFDGHLVITWLCEMERHFKWTAVINLIACCLLIVDCWLLTVDNIATKSTLFYRWSKCAINFGSQFHRLAFYYLLDFVIQPISCGFIS